MSAVRLIWLMDSRGVLFATLAVFVLILATSLILPTFIIGAHEICPPGGSHIFDYCMVPLNLGFAHSYLPFSSLIILFIGLLYGAYRGLQQWRTRALAGW